MGARECQDLMSTDLSKFSVQILYKTMSTKGGSNFTNNSSPEQECDVELRDRQGSTRKRQSESG